MPTAPVPAQRSSHTLPSKASMLPADSTLNRVSRRRSAVGRKSRPRNECRERLRNFPAITRMVLPVFAAHKPLYYLGYTEMATVGSYPLSKLYTMVLAVISADLQ